MMNYDNKIQAQPNSNVHLPQLDSLLTVLDCSDSISHQADLSEYEKTYRFTWLYLMPSVGFNVFSNRPTIIFNTSGFVSYFNNKRVVKRKEISINNKFEIQHKQNKIKLVTQYNSLINSIVQLNMLSETFSKYVKLYEMKHQQYKSNEIDAETFMKESISQDERKRALTAQVDLINAIMVSIELLLNTKVFEPFSYNPYLL